MSLMISFMFLLRLRITGSPLAIAHKNAERETCKEPVPDGKHCRISNQTHTFSAAQAGVFNGGF